MFKEFKIKRQIVKEWKIRLKEFLDKHDKYEIRFDYTFDSDGSDFELCIKNKKLDCWHNIYYFHPEEEWFSEYSSIVPPFLVEIMEGFYENAAINWPDKEIIKLLEKIGFSVIINK